MYGRELREAFDPCINISIGTAMLSQFDYECSRAAVSRFPPRPYPHGSGHMFRSSLAERRKCVVRKYGEAVASPDFALVTALEVRAQRHAPADETTNSPIESDQPAHPWGANCLLLPFAADSHGPLEGATGGQLLE
jgi:hypothetical protein